MINYPVVTHLSTVTLVNNVYRCSECGEKVKLDGTKTIQRTCRCGNVRENTPWRIVNEPAHAAWCEIYEYQDYENPKIENFYCTCGAAPEKMR